MVESVLVVVFDFFDLDFVNCAHFLTLLMLMGREIHSELGCAHGAYLVAMGCKLYFKIDSNSHSIRIGAECDSFFVKIK